MAKANPYSFFVALADGIMEIPQSSNLSWLTLVYALPKELVAKRPDYLELPRNIHQLLQSEKYKKLIKSDFLNWSGTATHGQHGSIFKYRARMASTETFPAIGRIIPATFLSGDCPMRYRSISATNLKRKWSGVSRSCSFMAEKSYQPQAVNYGQEPRKTHEKCPYCVTGARKELLMRTGLKKQEKTTEIWFDEKDPTIYNRTHNTDLKKRLAAFAVEHSNCCKQTDTDPETGCMEFEIAKGRFSFRLTAPYSEERRRAASDWAKKNGIAIL